MLDSLSVLALVTARGGSQGIPRKNIRDVAGRPMMAWTIEAAQASRYIDRLIISTDDEEIADVARAYGCEVPFMRPAELATSASTSLAAVRHAIQEVSGYDVLVLLQPTSPLRTTSDIDGTLEVAKNADRHAAVTVCPIEKSGYLLYEMTEAGTLKKAVTFDFPIGRRQDLPAVYSHNGAVYVTDCESLAKGEGFSSPTTKAFCMSRENSFDVDEPLDLVVVDALMRKRHDFQ